MKRVLICTLLAAATLAAPAAAQSPPDVMRGYAADTWRSFEAMTDEGTGLPSDNVKDTGERAEYTSPTNIGAYLWSTIAARDLGIIGAGEARTRLAQTLTTVGRLERHEKSGQYFNWYSPTTGAKLTVWPVDGSPVYPFLSSVDNGWLAAALMMVERAEPSLAAKARALYEPMDFGFYYDPGPGQLRGARGTTRARPATCPRRATTSPATTTARSTPSRASRPTSASRADRCRSSTTSGSSARSRARTTGAGRSSVRTA
jgi:hypothetical protein